MGKTKKLLGWIHRHKTPQTADEEPGTSGGLVSSSTTASGRGSLNPNPTKAGASTSTSSDINASSPECLDNLSQQSARPSLSINKSNSPSPLMTAPIALPTAVSPGLNQDTSYTMDPTHSIKGSQPPTSPPFTSTVVHRELWSEALDKLAVEDQEAIQALQAKLGAQRHLSKTSIDKIFGLIEDVQKKCKEKSFRFDFRGKEIIMRDVAGKIIYWVSKFKEVGDVAVNFDPIHASLPWAGVRFLLEVAISEHEQMGVLVMAVEKISCLINRGAIYERLYRPGTISADVLSNLRDAIVKMYATMLQMMALCHRLFDKNFAKRALHAIFNSDVSALLEKCQELEVQVKREADNCAHTRSQEADTETKRLLVILQDPILRTDNNVITLLEKMEERELLKILDWISKVLYGTNHRTVTEERTPNTCEWLLSHSYYQEWQDASASIILWLCGNPGTGKTFLTSKVIDEIQGPLRSKPNQEGFAFFYCNRNDADRREPLSVLRAFVRQLSTTASDSESIQKSLKQFYSESRLKASQLTISDCKNLLLEFINIYPRTTLVLDALDECKVHGRLKLIEVFDELLTQASNPLKIFISSRPDLDIKRKLKDRANIEIEAKDNHYDITRFVNNRISQHPTWHMMDSELQERIVKTLQDQSQGMFQWAFLQIEQLLELELEEHILDRLGKLPKDLKKAYDEIYGAMNEYEKPIANRAFQWVMCTCTPLNTKTLLTAISQDENSSTLKPLGGLNEDLVLKYCHHLLVIDPVSGYWTPSHLSVIEYFEDYLWSQSQANYLVTSVCLLLLQNTVFWNRQKRWARIHFSPEDSPSQDKNDQKDPLHGQGFEHLALYAMHHWPIHAHRVTDTNNKNQISTRLEEFLGLPANSSLAYRCWHSLVSNAGYDNRPSNSFFRERRQHFDLLPASMASFAYCACGLATLLPTWHDVSWIKDDIRTETGRTFLELAVISGSIPTCRLLIKHGVQVNSQTKTPNGSALAAAAAWGQKEMVEFLVKEGGAEVNMQLQYGNYGSVLVSAVFCGRKEIVEFLVREGGAEVNIQVQYGIFGSALAAAAASGQKAIVEFLVKEGGAEVNMQIQNGDYGSALVTAIAWGQKEIVEFLVKEGGAEVNIQVQYGTFGSALAAAAASGQKAIVEFLVKEGGAEVNMQAQHGIYGSALVAAANKFWGGKEIVEFLVKEGGAEVNMQVQYGKYGSALVAATTSGEKEVLEFLVKELGAEVNMQVQYGDYGSALVAAAVLIYGEEDDEEEDSEEDEEEDGEEDEEEEDGEEDEEEEDGEEWVLEFLLKEGRADVNMQLQYGEYASALEAAEDKGTFSMVQLLIKYGAKRGEPHGRVIEVEESDDELSNYEETQGREVD